MKQELDLNINCEAPLSLLIYRVEKPSWPYCTL